MKLFASLPVPLYTVYLPRLRLLLLLYSWNIHESMGFRNENLFDKFVEDVMKAQKTDHCDLNYVTENVESEISKLLADLSLHQR